MSLVRVKVTIQGSRTLLQNYFGPNAIPLEKQEKEGVAGNNPGEWKKTCMVAKDGTLYLPGTYVFGCLKNGALHTKKGRGTIQASVISTLQIEEDTILLNRKCPAFDKLTQQITLSPPDDDIETFIYVSGVKNKATGGRNVRYRLATRAGWKCSFTIVWENTIVSRGEMEAVVRDAGLYGGLGDGLKIGCGRFSVTSYEVLSNAKETSVGGGVADEEEDRLVKRRTEVRPLLETVGVGENGDS